MPYKDPSKKRASDREAYKRWVERNPEKARANQDAYRNQGSRRRNGKRWTPAEIERLLTFEGRDADLSQELGRSIMSIQMKRLKTSVTAPVVTQLESDGNGA